MKQLIILLFIPVMASAQVKIKPAKADSVGKWTTREPDYVPGGIKEPVRIAQEITWWRHTLDSTRTMEYIITVDNRRWFWSILHNDTLYVTPSIFDSSAVKAKWIKVAGKIFELKK